VRHLSGPLAENRGREFAGIRRGSADLPGRHPGVGLRDRTPPARPRGPPPGGAAPRRRTAASPGVERAGRASSVAARPRRPRRRRAAPPGSSNAIGRAQADRAAPASVPSRSALSARAWVRGAPGRATALAGPQVHHEDPDTPRSAAGASRHGRQSPGAVPRRPAVAAVEVDHHLAASWSGAGSGTPAAPRRHAVQRGLRPVGVVGPSRASVPPSGEASARPAGRPAPAPPAAARASGRSARPLTEEASDQTRRSAW